MYLVLSALTSSPISLVAASNASELVHLVGFIIRSSSVNQNGGAYTFLAQFAHIFLHICY